jgi:hypothetical protein
MLRRFGYRGTLGLGILAWAVRYGSLVADPPLWVALAGIPLHGVGIACFTIGGQVFLDGEAPDDRRAGAQALNVVVTSGIGSLLGNLLAGEITGQAGTGDATVFLVPCLINVGLLLYFVQGFRPHAARSGRAAVPGPVPPPAHDVPGALVLGVGHLGTESADG